MNSLDIGCGFIQEHKKRATIGIDIQKGLCDIRASAEHLPFQDGVFQTIYAYDILEHLRQPIECLREMNRVASSNSEIFIKIPAEPKMMQAYWFLFKKLILEFPFSVLGIIKYLTILNKHKREPGYLHINEINPSHIARELHVKLIEKRLMWKIKTAKGQGLSSYFLECEA